MASAEIVTYEFVGKFTGSIYWWEQGMSGSYAEWGNEGGPFNSRVGDTITGRFTYDTSTKATPSPGNAGAANYYGAVTSMTIDFPGSGSKYVSNDASTLNTASQAGNGSAQLSSSYEMNSYTHMEASISAKQAPGTDLSANLFGNATFGFHETYSYLPSWAWFPTEGGMDASGEILSLTRVSAVPEPSSWAMFAAGALALAGMAYARRRPGN